MSSIFAKWKSEKDDTEILEYVDEGLNGLYCQTSSLHIEEEESSSDHANKQKIRVDLMFEMNSEVSDDEESKLITNFQSAGISLEETNVTSSKAAVEADNLYQILPISALPGTIDKFCRKIANSYGKESDESLELSAEYYQEDSDPFLTFLNSTENENDFIDILSNLDHAYNLMDLKVGRILKRNQHVIFDGIKNAQNLSLLAVQSKLLLKNCLTDIAEVRRRSELNSLVTLQKLLNRKKNLNEFYCVLEIIHGFYNLERSVKTSFVEGKFGRGIEEYYQFVDYFEKYFGVKSSDTNW